MEFAKEYKKGFLLISAGYLILGIVLLIFPTLSLQVVCYVLGGITLLYGIMHLIAYFVRTDFGQFYRLDFVWGVLLCCGGVYVIAQPLRVAQMLPVLLGLAVLLDSLIKLQNALDLRRLGVSLWWIVLCLSAATAVLGIVLVLNRFAAMVAATRFIGIALMVDGCVNLFSFFFLAKQLQRMRRALTTELSFPPETDFTQPATAQILRPDNANTTQIL